VSPLVFAAIIGTVGLLGIIVWLIVREEGQDEKRGRLQIIRDAERLAAEAQREEEDARNSARGRMLDRIRERRRLRDAGRRSDQ
jgi:hypothetical protein